MLPANTTSSPHLLSLWQLSGLTAEPRAGGKEKEPCLCGLWKFPTSAHRGVACFSHSALQKGNTWGPAHFLPGDRRYRYRDTSASFGNKPTPFFPPPSPGGAQCPGGVLVHRQTDTRPWKAGGGVPPIPRCLPAPPRARLSPPAGLPVPGRTASIPVLAFPRHFQLCFQESAGAADASYPWKSSIKVSKESLKIQSVKPRSERAQDGKGSSPVHSPPPHTGWEEREMLRNKNQGK